MSLVRSGVTTDLLSVVSGSKGFRGSLYDAAGNLLRPSSSAVFFAPINLVSTTDQLIHFVLWNRSTNTKAMYLRRLLLGVHYQGGARTVTSGTINLIRAVVANGQSISSVAANVTPVKRATGGTATQITAGDCGVGSATVGVSLGAGSDISQIIDTIKYPCDITTPSVHDYNWIEEWDANPETVLETTTTVGSGKTHALIVTGGVNSSSYTGYVEWEER